MRRPGRATFSTDGSNSAVLGPQIRAGPAGFRLPRDASELVLSPNADPRARQRHRQRPRPTPGEQALSAWTAFGDVGWSGAGLESQLPSSFPHCRSSVIMAESAVDARAAACSPAGGFPRPSPARPIEAAATCMFPIQHQIERPRRRRFRPPSLGGPGTWFQPDPYRNPGSARSRGRIVRIVSPRPPGCAIPASARPVVFIVPPDNRPPPPAPCVAVRLKVSWHRREYKEGGEKNGKE